LARLAASCHSSAARRAAESSCCNASMLSSAWENSFVIAAIYMVASQITVRRWL
jgi:hypothetical protein